MSTGYVIRPDDAGALADAATEVQSHAIDAQTYSYAAGVEDALRFVLGGVSGRVFAGFTAQTEPFASGGDAVARDLTEVALRFVR